MGIDYAKPGSDMTVKFIPKDHEPIEFIDFGKNASS